jgi:hypothetical protein
VGGGQDDTEDALAAFGLKLEGEQVEPGIWPEHAQAVEVFASLLTQWRIGPMGGVVGLDYGAIPPVLEMLGIKRKKWPLLFEQLRVMENEAVKTLNKK